MLCIAKLENLTNFVTALWQTELSAQKYKSISYLLATANAIILHHLDEWKDLLLNCALAIYYD